MYKSENLLEKAKALIIKEKLCFLQELASFLGVSKNTIYNHFPTDSDHFAQLKDLIQQNRTMIKKSIREKWLESQNASLQIALYKLLADDDELKRLSSSPFTQEQTEAKAIQINISPAAGNEPILLELPE